MSRALLDPEAAAEFQRGWRVLFACFLGVGVGVSSLLFYTSGVFILPLNEAFGWSRSQVSAQNIVGVAILALLSPFVGMLIDRFGIRRIAFLSLIAFACGMAALSVTPGSLLAFYAITLVMAVMSCGSSPVTFTRAVNGWFDKARGLALGVALLGTGVAGILAPLMLTPFVEEFGWRAGYRVLALIIAASAAVVYLLIRDAPAGETAGAAAKTQDQSASGVSFAEAARSRTFVLLALIFFLVACAVGGAIVHFIPMLRDAGMSPAEAGRYAAIIGVSIMAGRLATGYLIDRFFAPRVAALLFGLAAIGYCAFLIGGPSLALVAAVAIGFSMGAEVDLIGYLVARYFGLQSYGVVYGALYAIFLIGAGGSPFLMGWAFDAFGGYDSALMGSTAALIAAAALTFALPAFEGPERRASSDALKPAEGHAS
ncbi:MAG: MFS transporter [Pseudomonadota bacterium]